MAQNIEIKAKASDFAEQLRLAENLADAPIEVLEQTDTFFNSTEGRLKLREFPNSDAELIFYHRSDDSGPKLSDYHISRTPDAQNLKHTLTQTLGQLAVVIKHRQLLISGRTRIHFDRVEGLGEFIELEVVLAENERAECGQQEAKQLMAALNISDQDLIAVAYVDLLLERIR